MTSTDLAILDVESGTARPDSPLDWLEEVLPRVMRRLNDSENLDTPLLQLPLAQLRLAQALSTPEGQPGATGEAMGRLSARLRVRQNALTQAADRLVAHGLAERIGDPGDRRVVRMRLTEKGLEWVRERAARRREALGRLWTALTPEEQQQLLAAVRVLEGAAARLEAVSMAACAASSEIDLTCDHSSAP